MDDFATQLEELAAGNGASLLRLQEGHSDRSFAVVTGQKAARFVAKLSQSETGFWGLGIDKATQMIESGSEHLVLLTSVDEGLFVTATRLKYLAPKFSKAQGDYKIGEGRVRAEPRFRSLEDLWELLVHRLVEL